MENEIKELKEEIERLKKELAQRPTKEEMEKFVKDYIRSNVPLI